MRKQTFNKFGNTEEMQESVAESDAGECRGVPGITCCLEISGTAPPFYYAQICLSSAPWKTQVRWRFLLMHLDEEMRIRGMKR